MVIFQWAVGKEWAEIEETVFRSAGENTNLDPVENKSKDGLLRRIDKNTLDVVGATEDATKASNEFFKKRPKTKKIAKKVAIATTVAAPGGVVAGPLIMYGVDKKEAIRMKNKIKKKISDVIKSTTRIVSKN